jgi:AraC-like DNA-binding protein
VPAAVLARKINLCGASTDGHRKDVRKSDLKEADFPEHIRRIIRSQLELGEPQIDVTAEILGVSTRGIQRELSKKNANYRDILGQERFRLAARLLENPNLSIRDVGCELGYASPPLFLRAFRRWSGVTPGVFRQSNFAA